VTLSRAAHGMTVGVIASAATQSSPERLSQLLDCRIKSVKPGNDERRGALLQADAA
jgi:hypothetical protein